MPKGSHVNTGLIRLINGRSNSRVETGFSEEQHVSDEHRLDKDDKGKSATRLPAPLSESNACATQDPSKLLNDLNKTNLWSTQRRYQKSSCDVMSYQAKVCHSTKQKEIKRHELLSSQNHLCPKNLISVHHQCFPHEFGRWSVACQCQSDRPLPKKEKGQYSRNLNNIYNYDTQDGSDDDTASYKNSQAIINPIKPQRRGKDVREMINIRKWPGGGKKTVRQLTTAYPTHNKVTIETVNEGKKSPGHCHHHDHGHNPQYRRKCHKHCHSRVKCCEKEHQAKCHTRCKSPTPTVAPTVKENNVPPTTQDPAVIHQNQRPIVIYTRPIPHLSPSTTQYYPSSSPPLGPPPRYLSPRPQNPYFSSPSPPPNTYFSSPSQNPYYPSPSSPPRPSPSQNPHYPSPSSPPPPPPPPPQNPYHSSPSQNPYYPSPSSPPPQNPYHPSPSQNPYHPSPSQNPYYPSSSQNPYYPSPSSPPRPSPSQNPYFQSHSPPPPPPLPPPHHQQFRYFSSPLPSPSSPPPVTANQYLSPDPQNQYFSPPSSPPPPHSTSGYASSPHPLNMTWHDSNQTRVYSPACLPTCPTEYVPDCPLSCANVCPLHRGDILLPQCDVNREKFGNTIPYSVSPSYWSSASYLPSFQSPCSPVSNNLHQSHELSHPNFNLQHSPTNGSVTRVIEFYPTSQEIINLQNRQKSEVPNSSISERALTLKLRDYENEIDKNAKLIDGLKRSIEELAMMKKDRVAPSRAYGDEPSSKEVFVRNLNFDSYEGKRNPNAHSPIFETCYDSYDCQSRRHPFKVSKGKSVRFDERRSSQLPASCQSYQTRSKLQYQESHMIPENWRKSSHLNQRHKIPDDRRKSRYTDQRQVSATGRHKSHLYQHQRQASIPFHKSRHIDHPPIPIGRHKSRHPDRSVNHVSRHKSRHLRRHGDLVGRKSHHQNEHFPSRYD